MGLIKSKLSKKLAKKPTNTSQPKTNETTFTEESLYGTSSESPYERPTKKRPTKENNVDIDGEESEEENDRKLFEADPLLRMMKKQLMNDPQSFVLNNLLMSVQFFENFEDAISQLRDHNVSTIEVQINKRLSKYQKHSIMPDTLNKMVDQTVQFCPKNQTGLISIEPLHPQRSLIVYENVEVLNPTESQEYCSLMEGPVYKCVTEDTVHHGYVKLVVADIEFKPTREAKTITVRRCSSMNDVDKGKNTKQEQSSLITIKEERPENENQSPTCSKPTFNRPLSMPAALSGSLEITTSESDLDSSDYGYATITKHYIPKPINTENQTEDNKDEIDLIGLPNKCITSLELEVNSDDSDYGSEMYAQKNKVKNMANGKINCKYLDSAEFVGHFTKVFMSSDLGNILGLSKLSISSAMQQGATIYVDIKSKSLVKNYEIVPCLMVTWPDVANDWKTRSRKMIVDPATNIGYKWPTQGTIDVATSLPCHLYPIGYTPKRSVNTERSIQWRLAFPAVEKFLLSCLTHTQIRSYLFTLTLYKSFIEPKETKLGLNTDHIRAHLFWECEKDFLRWPQERLGEKLMLFLLELKTRMAVSNLPDYFLPKRNLFENIPMKHLNITANKLHNILENPIMHLLVALNNLKFLKDGFYPVLDYKRLYLILMNDKLNEMPTSYLVEKLKLQYPKSVKQEVQTKISKDEAYYGSTISLNTSTMSSTDSDLRSERMNRIAEKRKRDAQSFWGRMREHEQLYAEVKKKKLNTSDYNNIAKKGLTIKTINLNIKPPARLTKLQQALILELFIDHFLQLAAHCLKFHWFNEAITYLEQIKRLIVLFHNLKVNIEQENFYLKEMTALDDKMLEAVNEKQKAPPIPRRNSQISVKSEVKQSWDSLDMNVWRRDSINTPQGDNSQKNKQFDNYKAEYNANRQLDPVLENYVSKNFENNQLNSTSVESNNNNIKSERSINDSTVNEMKQFKNELELLNRNNFINNSSQTKIIEKEIIITSDNINSEYSKSKLVVNNNTQQENFVSHKNINGFQEEADHDKVSLKEECSSSRMNEIVQTETNIGSDNHKFIEKVTKENSLKSNNDASNLKLSEEIRSNRSGSEDTIENQTEDIYPKHNQSETITSNDLKINGSNHPPNSNSSIQTESSKSETEYEAEIEYSHPLQIDNSERERSNSCGLDYKQKKDLNNNWRKLSSNLERHRIGNFEIQSNENIVDCEIEIISKNSITKTRPSSSCYLNDVLDK